MPATTLDRSERCKMENRKKLFRIGPDARQLEPGRGSERAKAINGVFVGKFGDDFFAGSEIKFAIAEVNGLRRLFAIDRVADADSRARAHRGFLSRLDHRQHGAACGARFFETRRSSLRT